MATTPAPLTPAPLTPAPLVTISTHGRLIGHVGALAVALGVGAAIASTSPAAAADEGHASASSTTSESPAGHRKPPRADAESAREARAARESDQDATRPASAGSGSDERDGVESRPPAPEDTVTDDAVDEDEKVDDGETVDAAVEQGPGEPVSVVPAASAATAAAKPTEPGRVTASPASPLATPQQLEAERIAAETVRTWPVRLMKLLLSAGWQATAAREYSLVSGADPRNIDELRRAVDEYALGAAFQQQLLDAMAPTVVAQVAPPHTWFGQVVGGSRILYDNPDTVYRFMGVNMTSTYVIRGRYTGAYPADTNFSVLTGLSGVTADNLSGRQLEVGPDGSFTITVSGQAAAPGQRNHLQLSADATLIAVRNTLSDWNTQSPMTLSIERLSGPRDSLFSQLGGFAIPGLGPLVTRSPVLTSLVSSIPPMKKPPPFLRGVFTAAIMLLGLGQESKYIRVATTDPQTGLRVAPNTLPNPSRNAEFLATQLQSAGYFHLADDQALVVTITPGNARYFTVPVTNLWTITGNYWDEQTSLNNAQAVADPDGRYTFVISPTDPGVHNWVSTGGLNKGTISIRFQDLDLSSTATPTLTSRVAALSEISSARQPRTTYGAPAPSALSPTTTFVTPAQRTAQLMERAAGFARRFTAVP